MPMLPATCDNCGTLFSSGYFVENATVDFSGNTAGPCPNCGGIGHVPDGVFNFVNNAIEILSAPQRSIDELIRFSSILSEAQNRQVNHDDLVHVVRNSSPTFSPLMQFLTNQNVQAWVAIILTIISMVISEIKDEPEQSPADKNPPIVHQTVNIDTIQVINNIDYNTNDQASLKNKPTRSVKIGRNEPCLCGSGVKYKRCHGK